MRPALKFIGASCSVHTVVSAYGDSTELRAAVARRVEGSVVDFRVTEVDEVRDTTRVVVRYRRLDGAPVGDFAVDLTDASDGPELERAQ